MPWVRFTGDFDFKPVKRVTLAFKAGQVRLVTTSCAQAAKAAGKAQGTVNPQRETKP